MLPGLMPQISVGQAGKQGAREKTRRCGRQQPNFSGLPGLPCVNADGEMTRYRRW